MAAPRLPRGSHVRPKSFPADLRDEFLEGGAEVDLVCRIPIASHDRYPYPIRSSHITDSPPPLSIRGGSSEVAAYVRVGGKASAPFVCACRSISRLKRCVPQSDSTQRRYSKAQRHVQPWGIAVPKYRVWATFRMRLTKVDKLCPAVLAATTYVEVVVSPGPALTSRTKGCPERSIRKSTRA